MYMVRTFIDDPSIEEEYMQLVEAHMIEDGREEGTSYEV